MLVKNTVQKLVPRSIVSSKPHSTMFRPFQKGPADPMYTLKKAADQDQSPEKADLGVGIYRNEKGVYSELDVVKRAKKVVANNDPGHDYEITTGNPSFVQFAAQLLFGKDSEPLKSHRVATVQTISGTGACHLAALAISQCVKPAPKVYVGVPAWGNYKPLFELVGLEAVEYSYYDAENRSLNFSSILSAAENAPPQSLFVLQGCCHNPTGADPTTQQWDELASILKKKNHYIFLDVAYQGLGNGFEEDSYAVQLFARLGLDLFVCQSFSKNFALYGERCGALHAVCSNEEIAANVHDRLRCLIRWEFSSSPAFGSRLVNTVLSSDELKKDWLDELSSVRHRLKSLRKQLHGLLTQTLKTPGNWDHILQETGLFSFLRLTPAQCNALIERHHIYLPPNGRINISGINSGNIEKVAGAIDEVVRSQNGST